MFFLSYESSKKLLLPVVQQHVANTDIAHGLVHMAAASLGEVAACSIRVPAEVIKQRAQASQYHSSLAALRGILANTSGEGVLRGLYRGYGTTILREIPFTMIQFPLYEYIKHTRAVSLGLAHVGELSPADGSVAGSIAGGVAAAVTTPLDVVKTRLMLHKDPIPLARLVRDILAEDGYAAFWKGVGPRTMWISAGGAIFLGVYEMVKKNTLAVLNKQDSDGEVLQ